MNVLSKPSDTGMLIDRLRVQATLPHIMKLVTYLMTRYRRLRIWNSLSIKLPSATVSRFIVIDTQNHQNHVCCIKRKHNWNNRRKSQVDSHNHIDKHTFHNTTTNEFYLRLWYTTNSKTHKSTKKQDPQVVWCQWTQEAIREQKYSTQC